MRQTGGEVVRYGEVPQHRPTARLGQLSVRQQDSLGAYGDRASLLPLEVGRVDERAGEYRRSLPSCLPGREQAGHPGERDFPGGPNDPPRARRRAKSPRWGGSTTPETAQPGDFLIVTGTHELEQLSRAGSRASACVIRSTGRNAERAARWRCSAPACEPSLRPTSLALVAASGRELFGISDAARTGSNGPAAAFVSCSDSRNGLSPENADAIKEAFDRLRRYDRWLYHLPAVADSRRSQTTGVLPGPLAIARGRSSRGKFGARRLNCPGLLKATNFNARMLEHLERLVTADQKHDGISLARQGALGQAHEPPQGQRARHRCVFLADPTGNFEHPIDLHIDRSGHTVPGYMAVYSSAAAGVGDASSTWPAHPIGRTRGGNLKGTFFKPKTIGCLRRGHPGRSVSRGHPVRTEGQ